MQMYKKNGCKTIIAGALALGLVCITAPAQSETYKGTGYIAGMGGHFAKAEFSVDPAATAPITISNLDKIDIGDGRSHAVHDARIDVNDNSVMYWSTYTLDAGADNQLHIGKTDLKTGNKTADITHPSPKGVLNDGKNYCASGQSKDYFFPISMSKPGYITVVRKSDMKIMHYVFIEGTDADPKKPYKYMHGVTSPDMKEFFITLNEGDTEGKPYGESVGKMHMIVLDTAELEKGKVKVLRKGVADGNAKSTISFRQYYSPDGRYIANATADILFLIDTKTLNVLDAETVSPLEQLHDAIFTPDGKYIIATSRSMNLFPDCADPLHPKPDEYLMDGHLKLYDVQAKKFIGKSTSACLACHDQELGRGENAVHAVLCGIDVNWAK